MTATTTISSTRKRTSLLAASGVLFVISAIALVLKDVVLQVQEIEYFDDPSGGDGYASLLPLFVLVVLEAGGLAVALVLLGVWHRSPLSTTVLAALGLAIPAGYLLQLYTGFGAIVDYVHAGLAVLAGVIVLVRGLLGRAVGFTFLLAMVVFALGAMMDHSVFVTATLYAEYVVGYVVASSYLLLGIAIVVRAIRQDRP